MDKIILPLVSMEKEQKSNPLLYIKKAQTRSISQETLKVPAKMTNPWQKSVFLITQPRNKILSASKGKLVFLQNSVPVNLSSRLLGSSHSIKPFKKDMIHVSTHI